MALQDLTPQLRTRLSRVERAVGWFVFLATGLLMFGFVYYVYNTAERKGWFLKKITYQTCVTSGAGLKEGDPVKLMGFNIGQITKITPNGPYDYFNITVFFQVKVDRDNYPGYIWTDSKVKVAAGDFLGGRVLEVTKGATGVPTVWQTTNSNAEGVLVRGMEKTIPQARFQALKTDTNKPDSEAWAEVWSALNLEARAQPTNYYTRDFEKNIYFLEPLEAPALTERLEAVASQVEKALPTILDLTNKIAAVLDSSAVLTSNLNVVALKAQPLLDDLRPTVTNLASITAGIQGPGKLGEWLIPTNINQKLDTTLGSADEAVNNLTDTLENLANLTSNLNMQVQANTNMLGSISKTVVDADDLVQGLKRHWLLKSAFKPAKTNAPAAVKKGK